MKHTALKALIAAPLISFSISATPHIHVHGADKATAQALHKRMIAIAAQTTRADIDQEGGPFGGFFDLAKTKYKDPMLVSTTDGIGIKCSLAQTIAKHDSIGFDLVANCVNSLVAQGAEPLFFIDYFATGKLNIDEGSQLLIGIAAACKESHCSLIGAQTIEIPGVYQQGAYDITGFAVGAVERDCILPRCESIEADDVIIGLAGTGIHANGFSRIVKVLQDKTVDPKAKPLFMSYHVTLADALLEPNTLYIRSVLPLCKTNLIKAIAHSADSLIGALDAIIPNHLGARIDGCSWHIPPLFRWIKQLCGHDDTQMATLYNLGIGMALITSPQNAKGIINTLMKNGMQASIIGSISSHPTHERITFDGTIQTHVMRFMIIGNGGSEHALAWKLAQSPYVGIVCIAPGNGGTSQEPKIKNIPINSSHINAVITYAQQNKIDLIIPGDSFVNSDFVDACETRGVRCLGPNKTAATLENAETFLAFCTRHAIPHTADVAGHPQLMNIAAVTDGITIQPFSSTLLYPYKNNGDKGERTQGMGAYSPAPALTPALENRIMKEIFEPLLHGMQAEDMRVRGFMHAIIIVDHAKLAINALHFGLGDPQAETILMRLKNDMCVVCNAAFDRELDRISLEWDTRSALATFLTAQGYPGQVKSGNVIVGIAPEDTAQPAKVFHHATTFKDGKLITNGGRVICATALGKTLDAARDAAYALIRNVYWPDLHYRTDIGYRNQ